MPEPMMMMGDDVAVVFEPMNGSWVAELEDAKEALASALRVQQQPPPPTTTTGGGRGHGAARRQHQLIVGHDDSEDEDDDNHPTVGNAHVRDAPIVMEAYLRVCRAYEMLRQWERLLSVSQKALRQHTASSRRNVSSTMSSYKAALKKYKARARAELEPDGVIYKKYRTRPPSDDFPSALHMCIVEPLFPDHFSVGVPYYANSNAFLDAAVHGAVRPMEATIAVGVTLDLSSFERFKGKWETRTDIAVPEGASPLLVLCMMLAIYDSSNPTWAMAKMLLPPYAQFDDVEECATQLVHLGADPNLTLRLTEDCSTAFNIPEMDGKSAFQIAAMSKRRSLVALMLEHMQLSHEERAERVHCRCGSRLPWKMCHSTGVGQPPHYFVSNNRVQYRVSPHARCPCMMTPKTYYKCCWKDNCTPCYLDDRTGLRNTLDELKYSLLDRLNIDDRDEHERQVLLESMNAMSIAEDEMLDTPTFLHTLAADLGPKSKMDTWDRHVYAGCVRRLPRRFWWTDVHWEVDRTVLLWRTHDWNAALERYCDDHSIHGEERKQVIDKHRANPCGPCGFVDCHAFETSVREFQRCAKCKSIAYCSRECQRSDWAQHKIACEAATTIDASRTETLLGDTEFCLSRLEAAQQARSDHDESQVDSHVALASPTYRALHQDFFTNQPAV